MGNDAYTRTPRGFFEQITRRITALERRLPPPSPTIPAGIPPGVIMAYPSAQPVDGWLRCDGQAVSRTTYADLFSVMNVVRGTVTVTIATPGVFTQVGHGLYTGRMVYLTTTGALPTGLSVNTAYYLIKVTNDTFRLATSYANAVAGTAINTTGTQSGTHTMTSTYGVGDGSTTFNLPDMRGRTIVGWDDTQEEFNALGEMAGAKTHTLTTGEMPSHTHSSGSNTNGFVAHATGGSGFSAIFINDGTGEAMFYRQPASVGSDGAHNNLQPYIVINYIVKT